MTRARRFLMILLACLAGATAGTAQSADVIWGSSLIGKPLYLKGFWHSDQLKFDGSGKLLSKSVVGPVTLSGVEVKRVTLDGDLLAIEGIRTALAKRSDGKAGLERRPLSSTTHLAFSLRRGDKKNFHAPEEMRILVEPDENGHFNVPLLRIFALGLPELAESVPLYWQCYAKSYFVPAEVGEDAEETVKRCVATPNDGTSDMNGQHDDTIRPPVFRSSTPMPPLVDVYELGVRGGALIHLRVTAEGQPVGLQVVRALGAGLDEAVLQTVSQSRFQPATRAGVAVPVDMNIEVRVQ